MPVVKPLVISLYLVLVTYLQSFIFESQLENFSARIKYATLNMEFRLSETNRGKSLWYAMDTCTGSPEIRLPVICNDDALSKIAMQELQPTRNLQQFLAEAVIIFMRTMPEKLNDKSSVLL